jgi:hypothetical protein
MLTAKRQQVVKFKTFLRTLVHEVCHHLDYVFFSLRDSFHTDGFFKRESSLMHQLLRPKSEAERPVSPAPVEWGRPAEAQALRSAAFRADREKRRIKFENVEDYS